MTYEEVSYTTKNYLIFLTVQAQILGTFWGINTMSVGQWWKKNKVGSINYRYRLIKQRFCV